jgi:hypothetical protein
MALCKLSTHSSTERHPSLSGTFSGSTNDLSRISPGGSIPRRATLGQQGEGGVGLERLSASLYPIGVLCRI